MAKQKNTLPGRMLYQNICDSQKIDKLSDAAEILYYRMYTNTDEFGRCKADPLSVRSYCFRNGRGRRALLRLRTIQSWIDQITEVGLWEVYEVDSQSYLQFTDFDKYQSFKWERREQFPAAPKSHPKGSGCTFKATRGGTSGAENTPEGVVYPASACEINETGAQSKLIKDNISNTVITINEEQKHGDSVPTPLSESEPESFSVLSWNQPVIQFNKDGSDGTLFDADTVVRAIHWALHRDDTYWVSRIQTLSGLRRCIATMVIQMGDYQIPLTQIIPTPKADCPICLGYGVDDERLLHTCACVQFFDSKGNEYSHWDYLLYCDRRGDSILKRLASVREIHNREEFEASLVQGIPA